MARLTLLALIRDQCRRPVPPVVSVDLTGKTVVVIGANTGLGFEASKHFARMNPGRLILGCRDSGRGTAALSRLKEETGYDGAELWLIDLADFASVKSFADKYEKEEGRLDYLVLNAAIVTRDYRSTKDGWESSLQVNCLGPSLLALRLVPRMIETAQTHSVQPRVVLVSSEMHFWTSLDTQVLENQQPLQVLSSKEYCTDKVMGRRYPDTKLLNVLFTRSLADHLADKPIIVNTVNPGYCISEIRRELKGFTGFVLQGMDKLLAFTTEEGSRKLVWAALGGADQENLRGAYINAFQVAEPSDFVLSEQGKNLQNKIWNETLRILSDVDTRIAQFKEV
ncbi:hypothetical protein M378DRAFT_6914 [Amanita muscaria Koide BX008]|uniref:Uncharacterized protein n=1 Tax=Amanita muscaria (strain Koide BX008) TaxID=946122 RepID=A0A0C2XNC9_AMAMK|nr:hypothetical protein M378DRAFT_6914 [Amanita muscaria Koide BX008]